MGKILLFDHANDGHHMLYNMAVIQGLLEGNSNLEICYLTCQTTEGSEGNEFEDRSLIKYVPYRIQKMLKKVPTSIRSIILFFIVLVFARRHGFKNIHFLYLDSYVLASFLLIPLTLGLKISGTMHWLPAKKSKLYILEFLLKYRILRKLIVHGEYTRNRLLEMRKEFAGRIESVIYPNLHDPTQYEDAKSVSTNLNSEILAQLQQCKRPFLLAFGGIRYEKGIDLLLKSLSEMEQVSTLVVAGPESNFKKSDLMNMISKYNLEKRVFMDIRFIPNNQLNFYFDLCDIVVLPYRKNFLGQSGPLTEGVTRSKIIIGPDNGEIGFTIQHFGLGLVFESENVASLAMQMDKASINLSQYLDEIRENQKRYQELINVETFKNKYFIFLNVEATVV